MHDLDQTTEQVATAVIGAALAVHRELGPGYLEGVYECAMRIELARREVPFVSQHAVRVTYQGVEVGEGRVDLIAADRVIVELKAVDELAPIHEALLLSYLKCTGLQLGLLLNFNTPILKSGIKRIIHSKP
jgi:GxxExxY protein